MEDRTIVNHYSGGKEVPPRSTSAYYFRINIVTKYSAVYIYVQFRATLKYCISLAWVTNDSVNSLSGFFLMVIIDDVHRFRVYSRFYNRALISYYKGASGSY